MIVTYLRMFEVQAGIKGSTVTEKYCQESPGLLRCLGW